MHPVRQKLRQFWKVGNGDTDRPDITLDPVEICQRIIRI
jgi:hypothetical protein